MKDFSWPVEAFNELEYKKFTSVMNAVKGEMKGKPIYIFGAGIRGCTFLKFCNMQNINISGFIDNDINKKDGCIGEYLIYTLEDILGKEKVFYVVISTETYLPIVQQLEKKGLIQERDFVFIEASIYNLFVHKFFSPKKKYLFLGDCIFSQVAVRDSVFNSLETMICDKLGENNVKVLGMHGMPIRTFYHLCRIQTRMGYVPEKVVLVVNTVMFTGKKNQLPRAQHTVLLQQIQKKMQYEDKEFKDYIQLTKERTERFRTDAFIESDQNVRNRNSERISKLRMRLNYMYDLDENEEGIIYLKKMADFCEKNSIEFIPFLPPVNFEYGVELFGNLFEEKYAENVEKIKKLLKKENDIEVVDAGHLLNRSEFASDNTINEISNYDGRCKEAEFIKNICMGEE